MNRAEKRQYKANLKKRGFAPAQIAKLIAFEEAKQFLRNNPPFLEGEKVKLKYDAVTSTESWIKNADCEEPHVIAYRKFVEDNKDKVLTVEWDSDHKDTPFLVCFAEDTSERKFLFYVGDIEAVEEDGVDATNAL